MIIKNNNKKKIWFVIHVTKIVRKHFICLYRLISLNLCVYPISFY